MEKKKKTTTVTKSIKPRVSQASLRHYLGSGLLNERGKSGQALHTFLLKDALSRRLLY